MWLVISSHICQQRTITMCRRGSDYFCSRDAFTGCNFKFKATRFDIWDVQSVLFWNFCDWFFSQVGSTTCTVDVLYADYCTVVNIFQSQDYSVQYYLNMLFIICGLTQHFDCSAALYCLKAACSCFSINWHDLMKNVAASRNLRKCAWHGSSSPACLLC